MLSNPQRIIVTNLDPTACLDRIRTAIQSERSLRLRPTAQSGGAPFIGTVNESGFSLRPNQSLTYYVWWRVAGRVQPDEHGSRITARMEPPAGRWIAVLAFMGLVVLVTDRIISHVPIHLIWITAWGVWIHRMTTHAKNLMERLDRLLAEPQPQDGAV